jgi:PAS domain S-box-containing protein
VAAKKRDYAFSDLTGAILESISDGVFTVDPGWRVTSFNRAAEEITGIPRKEALGRLCSEVFKSSMCGAECALQRTQKSGKPVINKSGYIIDANGDRIPIIHLATGMVVGYPPCPHIAAFKAFLEKRYDVKVIVGTHPIPKKYFDMHTHLGTWEDPIWKPLIFPTLSDEITRSLYD